MNHEKMSSIDLICTDNWWLIYDFLLRPADRSALLRVCLHLNEIFSGHSPYDWGLFRPTWLQRKAFSAISECSRLYLRHQSDDGTDAAALWEAKSIMQLDTKSPTGFLVIVARPNLHQKWLHWLSVIFPERSKVRSETEPLAMTYNTLITYSDSGIAEGVDIFIFSYPWMLHTLLTRNFLVSRKNNMLIVDHASKYTYADISRAHSSLNDDYAKVLFMGIDPPSAVIRSGKVLYGHRSFHRGQQIGKQNTKIVMDYAQLNFSSIVAHLPDVRTKILVYRRQRDPFSAVDYKDNLIKLRNAVSEYKSVLYVGQDIFFAKDRNCHVRVSTSDTRELGLHVSDASDMFESLGYELYFWREEYEEAQGVKKVFILGKDTSFPLFSRFDCVIFAGGSSACASRILREVVSLSGQIREVQVIYLRSEITMASRLGALSMEASFSFQELTGVHPKLSCVVRKTHLPSEEELLSLADEEVILYYAEYDVKEKVLQWATERTGIPPSTLFEACKRRRRQRRSGRSAPPTLQARLAWTF